MAARPPVLFVHGLWLHRASWEPWVALFRARGYDAEAVDWPGEAADVASARRQPEAFAGLGIGALAAHVAQHAARCEQPPVLIGHSLGGLLVQQVARRAAAIALVPAPMAGIRFVPWSTFRATAPVLGNPFNARRAVSLTRQQFRYGFANAVPDEADALYEAHAVPAPARPLFETALAVVHPRPVTRVEPGPGPLLLAAGGRDHTVPPALVRRAHRRYGRAAEYVELSDRGHSLTIDAGWRDVAERCLAWLDAQSL